MIPGEEISDRAEGKPVHMNASNVRELILPVGGATVREAMQNNLRLVLEQEKSSGRAMLPHLNHPNFGYAVTAEDLAAVVQEQFFEIYNGHPSVNQLGDKNHQSIEQMWDLANAIRVFQLEADPLMGLATDDSHEYHNGKGATTGRGWVMVQARYLTPEHIINSMKQGNFYASSGVELSKVQWDAEQRTVRLQILPEEGVTYRTELVGTAVPAEEGLPSSEDIGKTYSISESPNVEFEVPAKIGIFRLRVTSSKPHPNPSLKGQFCQAWTQPIVSK